MACREASEVDAEGNKTPFPVFLTDCRHPMCVTCARGMQRKWCGVCGKDWPVIPDVTVLDDGTMVIVPTYGRCMTAVPFKQTRPYVFEHGNAHTGLALNTSSTIEEMGRGSDRQRWLYRLLADKYKTRRSPEEKAARIKDRITGPVTIHKMDNDDILLLATNVANEPSVLDKRPSYNVALIDRKTCRSWKCRVTKGHIFPKKFIMAMANNSRRQRATKWPLAKLAMLYKFLEERGIDYGQPRDAASVAIDEDEILARKLQAEEDRHAPDSAAMNKDGHTYSLNEYDE